MSKKLDKIGIFGAYDIRGKYPEEIDGRIIGEIIPVILKVLKIKKSGAKIVVGHDARLSSPSLYEAVVNGLKIVNCKLKIVAVGMITTPMIYFLVNELAADGGIVVTASHNPKEYNGIKVVNASGLPVSGKDIYAQL